MKKLLLILLACSLTACATTQTDTPLVMAGKSLLAVKSTIVTTATAIDGLCKTQKISADKCQQAKVAYEMSKPAYDTAIDAYLLMGQGHTTPAEFEQVLGQLRAIGDNLTAIAGGVK